MNTFRGEKDFDNGGSIVFNGDVETSYSTTTTFEPRDEVKETLLELYFIWMLDTKEVQVNLT